MRQALRSISRFAIAASLGVAAMASVGSVHAQQSGQIMLDVDAPGAGASVMNGQPLDIGGWAVDPGGTISRVDVYLDSPQGGAPIGTSHLGVMRRDVASTLGNPEWASSGYNVEWVPINLAEGQHTLYVVARSTDGQTAMQTVSISGCGCGLQGSYTNPIVTGLGPLGWELDTGGPGVWMERPDMGPGMSQ